MNTGLNHHGTTPVQQQLLLAFSQNCSYVLSSVRMDWINRPRQWRMRWMSCLMHSQLGDSEWVDPSREKRGTTIAFNQIGNMRVPETIQATELILSIVL